MRLNGFPHKIDCFHQLTHTQFTVKKELLFLKMAKPSSDGAFSLFKRVDKLNQPKFSMRSGKKCYFVLNQVTFYPIH